MSRYDFLLKFNAFVKGSQFEQNTLLLNSSR
jgi:hypothetical protein